MASNRIAIILGSLGLALTGCATTPVCHPIIQTKEITVYVPVNQVPAPPTVTPPTLALTALTSAQKGDIGELAKAYNITVVQLEDYASALKKIVDSYAAMAAQNAPVVNVNTASSAPSSAPIK